MKMYAVFSNTIVDNFKQHVEVFISDAIQHAKVAATVIFVSIEKNSKICNNHLIIWSKDN